MVFVTVGNAHQGFLRLLEAVDRVAGEGGFGGTSVFIQSGHNPGFRPRHCEAMPFVSMDDFERRMKEADLIVCHGGCTQLQAVALGKTPVVMPRRQQYGEHVNDHQVQLVEALAAEGYVVPAREPQDLTHAVREARRRQLAPRALPPTPMLDLVGRVVDELMNAPSPAWQRSVR